MPRLGSRSRRPASCAATPSSSRGCAEVDAAGRRRRPSVRRRAARSSTHPRGRPIAAAAGTAWLVVRSGLPAGALRAARRCTSPGLDRAGWVELDPWAPDVAFARAIDLLRAHVARVPTQLAGGRRVSLGWMPVERRGRGRRGGRHRRASRRARRGGGGLARVRAVHDRARDRARALRAVARRRHGLGAEGEPRDRTRASTSGTSSARCTCPNEHGLQHLFLKSSLLIQACNVFYATVHIPSMGVFLVWLWFRHRDHYPAVRNVVALTTLVVPGDPAHPGRAAPARSRAAHRRHAGAVRPDRVPRVRQVGPGAAVGDAVGARRVGRDHRRHASWSRRRAGGVGSRSRIRSSR